LSVSVAGFQHRTIKQYTLTYLYMHYFIDLVSPSLTGNVNC